MKIINWIAVSAFAFLVFGGWAAHAQPTDLSIPDSLQVVLNETKTDSAKIAIYSNEIWKIRFTDPARAVAYSRIAIDMASEAGLDMMRVDALTNLGYTYEIMGEADSSKKYYYEGYELAIAIAYIWGAIDGVNGSGGAYLLMGDWEKAIEMYEIAIYLSKDDERPLKATDTDFSITNEIKPLLLADAYNNIGVVYENQRQLKTALEYYQKSFVLYPEDNRARVIALMNIAGIHLELENLEKAIEYYSRSREAAKLVNDVLIEARIHYYLGKINQRLENYPLALEEFKASLDKYQVMSNERGASKIQADLAAVYFDMEDFPESLNYFLKSLEYGETVSDTSIQSVALLGAANCHILLFQYNAAEKKLNKLLTIAQKDSLIIRDTYVAFSLLYEKTKQFEKAFQSQSKFVALNAQLLEAEKSKQIAEIEARFETSEKEKAIDLLNAQNEISALQLQRRENQRNILIATVLVFMILVAVLYNRFKTGSKTNKKLKELDEMKTKFFTNISHEFRTPLTLILGPVVERLSRENSPKEKNELLIIKRNTDRLLELINQLLDLAKLEAGKLELHVHKGDFIVFVKNIAYSFESLAEQRQIKLSINVPYESKEILFDADKCQLILYNLLSNAFKFTAPSGEVGVDVYYNDTTISVVVKDTGKGIPKNDLNNIFKRFHQLDESKHHQQGTGIGLALVKELVTLHHGEVEVDSEVNVGTTFTIHFPLSETTYENDVFVQDDVKNNPLAIASVSPVEEVSAKEKIDASYVLIVEDNLDVRNYIKSVLSDTYNVLEATNGKEGYEVATERVPDLIISDVMMPVMDGTELCAKVKTDEKTSHIPVILLTAKADDASKMQGLQTGADDYLIKPFNEKILRTRVNNLIEQRKKLREKYSGAFSLEPSQIAITPPDKAFMQRVMELVEVNIPNYDFSVEDFQREMGMSRMQLHRKLKALTDCSASAFIRKQRLRRAAQILKIEGTSVSEAAYTSGFNNLSYFAKCFKEEFGKSPSNYAQTTEENQNP